MKLDELSPEDIATLMANLHTLPVSEQEQLLADLEAHDKAKELRRAKDDFLVFCKRVYRGVFKEGPHHRHLKPLLTQVLVGEMTRMTISMAPRFGKSELIAFLYVAWYLGHNPTHQIMMVTHTESLSASFGRKVRDLIDGAEYQEIFPETKVSSDKSAAGSWTTTAGGVYLALGVGGSAAGKGADLLIVDDAVSEQAVLYGNPDTAFEQAWNYIQVGPLQRLMPGGRIVMIATRWGKKDPIGRALQWAIDNPDSPPWHEVRFPAIMPSGKSLWPEQWPIDQLLAKKASMRSQYWGAQYMQEPTGEEGALIKREYWKIWPKEKPPAVEFILQAWDTAHETKTNNDFSASTTFGVWFNEESERHELILLDRINKRMEFPELKRKAKEHHDLWEPEVLLIEKKAAGAPLIQELRTMGLFIEEVSPSRGARGMSNDKYARVNAVAPVFEDGCVWRPDNLWAQEVSDQCAEFPNGEHDDLCDCVEMVVSRYRRGGFLKLSADDKDVDNEIEPRRFEYY
jgi:predicted phage terminase large subunit-like protein